MGEEIKSFEDLKAYKACRAFRMFVSSSVIPLLLSKKEFDLMSQLKRASRSVTANLAEGYGRFHYMDNSKFCGIARGSLYESLEHIITAHDEQLIQPSLLEEAREHFEHAIKLINGYINYLYKTSNKEK